MSRFLIFAFLVLCVRCEDLSKTVHKLEERVVELEQEVFELKEGRGIGHFYKLTTVSSSN